MAAVDKKEAQRRNLVEELLSTERSLLNALEFVDKIRRDLEQMEHELKPALPPEKTNKIFFNWEFIVELHTEILQELNKRIKEQERLDVGDIFVQQSGNLRRAPYRKFLSTYPTTRREVELAMTQHREFKRYIEASAARDAKGLDGYMVQPLQRIFRYQMLLQELMKCAPADDPQLEAALELVGEVVQYHDAQRGEVEEIEKVKSLQSRLGKDVACFKPGRRLIHGGNLTKICTMKHCPYAFLLFNDVLMYADGNFEGGDRLRLHKQFSLEQDAVVVQDLEDNDRTGLSHAFYVTNKVKAFPVYAVDEATKERWRTAFNSLGLLKKAQVSPRRDSLTLARERSGDPVPLSRLQQPHKRSYKADVEQELAASDVAPGDRSGESPPAVPRPLSQLRNTTFAPVEPADGKAGSTGGFAGMPKRGGSFGLGLRPESAQRPVSGGSSTDRPGGIGFAFVMRKGAVIQDIVPGGAAAMTRKINRKDLIVAVDGTDIRQCDFTAAKQLFAGPANHPVLLRIQRGKEEFEVSVIRQPI